MRISSKGEYALKAVLELSKNYGKDIVTIADLSRTTKTPKKFLEHILIDLKKGGFVESRRGSVGGYSLTKSPGRIKLGDVIEAIEGPIRSGKNSAGKKPQGTVEKVFDRIWNEVAESTLDILGGITFEDLLSRIRTHNEAIDYVI